MIEILEVRQNLEGLAANFAASRMTGEELAELRETSANYNKAVEAGSTPEMIRHDIKFHRLIADSSHNKILVHMVEQLQELVAAEPRVRALGSRHSFTDLADTTGVLVSLDAIPGQPELDGDRVRVPAGTKYGDLAVWLHQRGRALANLASLPHISVAGAIATMGVAVGTDALDAYAKAFKTDPTSAFGGIIAFNHPVDLATAQEVTKQFVEVLMAPAYSPDALAVFQATKAKQNVRVLQIDLPGGQAHWDKGRNAIDIKRVGSGLLMQTADNHTLRAADLKVVTQKQPTPQQIQDLLFAWQVAQYVKSNAIVFCKDGMTLGVGAGQMSRLDSARIASIKAEHAGLSLQGSAVASDAFFPFRDGLDVVIDHGATCVIQPGGSMRDQEVIDAANERGVAMVFSGVRHFRH
jgi:hypothetical protein